MKQLPTKLNFGMIDCLPIDRVLEEKINEILDYLQESQEIPKDTNLEGLSKTIDVIKERQ